MIGVHSAASSLYLAVEHNLAVVHNDAYWHPCSWCPPNISDIQHHNDAPSWTHVHMSVIEWARVLCLFFFPLGCNILKQITNECHPMLTFFERQGDSLRCARGLICPPWAPSQ